MAAAAVEAGFEPYVIGPSNKTFDANVSGWSNNPTIGNSVGWVGHPYGVSLGAMIVDVVDFWGSYMGEAVSDAVPAAPGWQVKLDLQAVSTAAGGWGYAYLDWLNDSNTILRSDIPEWSFPYGSSLLPLTYTPPPAPAGTTKVRIRVTVGEGYGYVDDVYLTRIA